LSSKHGHSCQRQTKCLAWSLDYSSTLLVLLVWFG